MQHSIRVELEARREPCVALITAQRCECPRLGRDTPNIVRFFLSLGVLKASCFELISRGAMNRAADPAPRLQARVGCILNRIHAEVRDITLPHAHNVVQPRVHRESARVVPRRPRCDGININIRENWIFNAAQRTLEPVRQLLRFRRLERENVAPKRDPTHALCCNLIVVEPR